MEFFGRKEEVSALRRIRAAAVENARMTVLTGRRRVGKTALAREALDDGKLPYVHLPITRQPEVTLCEQLQAECEDVLHLDIHGTCRRFGELFKVLMAESVKRPFTLVLDEFQEFDRTNPGVFGDIQSVWDRYQPRSKINLVISGSVNRLMNKIFFSDNEPLYGRNTGHLQLLPFKVSLIKEIFRAYHPKYKPSDLLALWTLTGGVARYVDLLMSEKAYTRKAMLETVFDPTSFYLDEGRTILADEFGPDYGTYFTILAVLSSGQTTSAELKNALGCEVGGYLAKLENQYGIISKRQPLFEKSSTKNFHYQIDDCFFRFWFRFVFKHRYLQELGRYDRMRELADRDFDVFSGYSLERYFQWKMREEASYTRMGAWWDRKGENEIDLVCEDETRGRLSFFEVKTDARRLDLDALRVKSGAFLAKNPEKRELDLSFGGLSLDDM